MFEWSYTSVHYATQWTNVLWDLLGYKAETSPGRLAFLVRNVMATSPAENLSAFELPIVDVAVSTAVMAHASNIFHRYCLLFCLWPIDWPVQFTFPVPLPPNVVTGSMQSFNKSTSGDGQQLRTVGTHR